MTAMTAMTLDHLSNGRFICGLGVSGPQVVEGWHGVRYGKPLVRTREFVGILRDVWAREKPLEHHGEHYDIPYRGPGASGLGKPLKSILHGRPIPIYLAAIGPKSVAQAAEIADGWLPIFYSPHRAPKVYQPSLDEGFAKAGGGKSTKTFDVAVSVTVIVGDDVQACLDRIKPQLALYIGGMGRAARTSTTTSPAATASTAPPRRFRTCTWRVARTRPPRPSRTSWPTRSRSADLAIASATAWPPGATRPSAR
jgi:F420-dependent oxidoreductase-like protein